MGRRVAILQSNYIPWKGYFDLIKGVDVFIIYDVAQFTKNDWRNRNRIKSPGGPAWLTIPVVHRFGQAIEETEVSDPRWAARHWKTIVQSYARAPHFTELKEWAQQLYLEAAAERRLSRINHWFLVEICRLLAIETRLCWANEFRLIPGRTERLVDLCLQAGATEYLSGPGARAYLDQELFDEAGIKVTYADYSGYPEYRQLFPPFEQNVSVLDLLFNEGTGAARFMKNLSSPPASRKPQEESCRDPVPERVGCCPGL
jgi:hypothetical protein